MHYLKQKNVKIPAIFLLAFFLFTSFCYAATWTVDTQGTFDEGAYNNTEYDTDSVKLKEWSDTEKELPHNGITDQWGIDMSGNILLMHMNEDAGVIIDNSGNGNDGTYNAALYSQSGKLNTAIGFDGDNDSINVGNDPSLDLDANLTISTWLKPTAYVNDGVILGKPHTSEANPYVTYTIGYSGDGKNYGLALGDGTTQRGCYTNSDAVTLNEWTHLTATFNGTQMNLYINGELNKSCPFGYFEINQNAADVLVGDYPYFGNTYDYSGDIDELAIFNRTLSDNEIETIYNRQAKKYGGNNPGDYVSKILDSQGNSKWENFSWTTELPYGQELPDNQATEAGGFIRGIDMTGNLGLWHFNESSGSIIDSSGNGNDGTVNGGVNYGADGKLGTALGFNGTDGYVNVPDHSSLNPTDEITLLAWVKWDIDPALGSSYASIINKNVDNQYRLHHDISNTNFEFAIRTDPNGGRWVDSTTVPQKDKWYFVVGTYDGSFLKIYVDGVLENTNSHAGALLTSASDLNIGRRTSNDRFFNGVIDEAAIFDRALTAQEIEDIYKRGALKLGLNVRSCDDPSCSGESWTDLGDNLVSPQNLSIADNEFFQYKFDFETDDSYFTPQLYDSVVGYNSSPDMPTNITPGDLANNIELTPDLIASAFSDSESDNHIDTDWRVDDNSDFSSPVWVRMAGTGENQTKINDTNGTFTNELAGKTELDYNTTYYWQVRYKDDGSNNWSVWSGDTSFTTLNTYTLAYTAGPNGSITGVSPQNVNYGSDGTAITAVPNSGYYFVDWSDGAVSNPRTDLSVTGDISVTANFAANPLPPTPVAGGRRSIDETQEVQEEEEEDQSTFADIDEHWAQSLIDDIYELGYIEGYEDNTFRPDQYILRSEVAKIVAMWLEENIDTYICSDDIYVDVSCENWYGKYIDYLTEKGILQGYGEGIFEPGRHITRAEALKIMLFAKALQDTSIDEVENPFGDVAFEDWHYNIVMIGYKLSFIEGYEDGTFGPKKAVTRAEFAKIFMEIYLW